MITRNTVLWVVCASLLTVAFLCPAFPPPLRAAADDYDDRRRPGRCLCHTGRSTYQYLRSPLTPPEDPSHCGLVRAGGDCGNRERPKGTSADCWGSTRRECFWKRHARMWDIACTLCIADDKCGECDASLTHITEARREELRRQVALERKVFGPNVVIARSPHFYVVTSADKRIKLLTSRGTKRLMTAHEIVHLYAQRCELAYEDFVHWFGPELSVMTKPMAVFVVDGLREFDAVGNRYFGGYGIHMNYAFAYNDRISGGYCGNGFVVSQRRETNESRMHMYARHQVGHILFSCWHLANGFESHCPRWAWIGAAHFLAKQLDIHHKYATYCVGEEEGANGPQDKWAHRVQKMAKKRMPPIETFFGLNSLGAFKHPDHLRAWSIMDLCMREDRTRWLALLKLLRHARDEGEAFKTALGITPEQFDARWKARVLGKRKTMGAAGDQEDNEQSGKTEREQILNATQPALLAGRIRGLDVVKDVATLRLVVPYLGHPSDLARETTVLLLLRTRDAALKEWIRTQGMAWREPLVRAEVLRVLGGLRYARARADFEAALGDRNWYARANAAWALAQIGAKASEAALLGAMGERDDRAWIAMADALASIEGQDGNATASFVPRLDHKHWQVRLSAVRGLARRGTLDAVDPLIERFDVESGRLREELYAALKNLTQDDLGAKASSWRAWWKGQKERLAKGLPLAPPKVKHKPADDRYGEPTREEEPPHYYGKRLYSKRVAYVLDVSGSMHLNMKVDPTAAKALGGIPASGTRIHIAQQAIIDHLKRLDARTEFDIVFFQSRVAPWRGRLVKASRGAVTKATTAVLRQAPDGETNFYGALKAAVGLHKLPSLNPKLGAIPDTVFFLTDGRPTRGEITAMPELVSWFANLNRFAKVTLHVIGLGDLNVDLPELQRLVDAGDGGVLIHVREAGTR